MGFWGFKPSITNTIIWHFFQVILKFKQILKLGWRFIGIGYRYRMNHCHPTHRSTQVGIHQILYPTAFFQWHFQWRELKFQTNSPYHCCQQNGFHWNRCKEAWWFQKLLGFHNTKGLPCGLQVFDGIGPLRKIRQNNLTFLLFIPVSSLFFPLPIYMKFMEWPVPGCVRNWFRRKDFSWNHTWLIEKELQVFNQNAEWNQVHHQVMCHDKEQTFFLQAKVHHAQQRSIFNIHGRFQGKRNCFNLLPGFSRWTGC